jgi:predicted Zn-dependent peptidase
MADYNPLVWTYLDNGIQVISQKNSDVNLSGTGFIVGSLYDPPKKRGMNHFVEHMTAHRSTRHSAREMDLLIWKLMGGYDGDVNIRVDRISTFFGHNDLFLRPHMLKAWDAFAQMVYDVILDARGKLKEPFLDQDMLKCEKAAVLNEYRLRGTDLPESEIQEFLYQAMWQKNPIRNRIDCEPDELMTITVSDVHKFIRRWYKTSRMFVVFFGPDHVEAVPLVQQYYGDLPASVGRDPELHGDVLPELSGIVHQEMVHPGSKQHHVIVGFPTEGYHSKHATSLDVLGEVLGFRMFQKLRSENRNEWAGVYRSPVFTERSFAHGVLYAHFATTGSYDYAMASADFVTKQCDQLKRKRLSKSERIDLQNEIDAAKYYKNKWYLNAFRRYPDILVEMVIGAVCNGDRDFTILNSWRESVSTVDAKAVQKTADRFLTTDRFVRVVLKPLTIPKDIYEKVEQLVPELLPDIKDFKPAP